LDGTFALTPDGPERRVLAPGRYQVRLLAVDAAGYREETAAEVLVEAVDTTPPHIEALQAEPATNSPRLDARNGITHITFRLTKAARVSLYAVDAQGRKAYLGVHDEARPAGEYAETWAGLVNERPLPDGQYSYTVEARDRAGNVSVAQVPVWLV